MADLAPQDAEKYEDLKNAFSQHNKEKDGDETVKKILGSVEIETKPNNTSELRQKIDTLELYLKILKLWQVELFKVVPNNPPNPQNKEEKEKLEQEFFTSLDALKLSLKVFKDETLDLTEEIEDKCSDSVILDFLQAPIPMEQQKYTEDLLDDRVPNLNNQTQVEKLIQAWETAVSAFVADARKYGNDFNPANSEDPKNTQKTLAGFFCIHNELELLYSRLADTEIVQRIS